MSLMNSMVNKEDWVRSHKHYFPDGLDISSVDDKELATLQTIRLVNPSTAFWLHFIGFGWLYAGRWIYWICQFILFPISAPWMIIDFFRIRGCVRKLNVRKLQVALGASNNVRIIL